MLNGLSKVQDVTQTLREFNRLDYEKPKKYKPIDIIKLRQKVLGVSQGVFAYVCNINVNTLQKWEQGKRNPSHSVYRLFQLFEKYKKPGLDFFKKQQA
jgi:DNA-binding transcriptional regulator YiaG